MDADVKALLEQHAALKGTSNAMKAFGSGEAANDSTVLEAKTPGEEFTNSAGFKGVVDRVASAAPPATWSSRPR
jgi:hypothetical protein